MLHALGAASAAIDALHALTSSKSSSKASRGANNPFELSADASASLGARGNPFSGGSPLSQDTMSAWLAIQGSSSTSASGRSDVLKKIFSEIDVDANAGISELEFGNALGAGGTNLAQAIHVFGRLDNSGDGTVSLGEMMSALNKRPGNPHRTSPGASADAGRSNSDPLLKDIAGASTTSVTNSDGSITTTLTYGDGSKVSMTSATSASASSASASYNSIERMIQRQAQAINAQAGTSLTV